jgi:formamidopyrimidine-DNA glycosylase
MVEIQAGESALLFTDGINLRHHANPAEQPAKHQLLVEFSDASALSATVSMYGGLWCFRQGTNDNPYYRVACEKPSPLGDSFTREYFSGLFRPEIEKLSLKAFLATEQRIPGLGNGVLQDILYRARLHPKRRVGTLKMDDRDTLYDAILTTLREMAQLGGRDTERDLFGRPGGYRTRVSRNTVGQPCPECGSLIVKQAYLGGSIYFCPGCQES